MQIIAVLPIIGLFGLAKGNPMPQTSDDIPCPLAYPCIDWSISLDYCFNVTDAPVYDAEGTFEDSTPIECVCGYDALGDESGLYALTECVLCGEIASSDEELVTLWAYTCLTADEIGLDEALSCWNSGTDCVEPEAATGVLRNKARPKMIRDTGKKLK